MPNVLTTDRQIRQQFANSTAALVLDFNANASQLETRAFEIRNASYSTQYATSEELVGGLVDRVRGRTPAEGMSILQSDLRGELASLEQAARERYGDGPGGKLMQALAGNRFLVKTYAAIAREVPEFHWAHVGLYVAHQVRGELINMYSTGMSINRTANYASGIPGATISGRVLGASYFQMMNDVYNGQKAIFTDIAPLALGYKAYGAERMLEYVRTVSDPRGTRVNLVNSFQKQLEADNLDDGQDGVGRQHQVNLLRMQAAQQLGVHEQTLIQRVLWDGWLASTGSRANQAMGLVGAGSSTNIYVGLRGNRSEGRADDTIGTINAPGRLRGNAADLRYRIAIANNAFSWMNNMVLSNPGSYNQHMSIANQLFNGTLYQPNTPPRPITRT